MKTCYTTRGEEFYVDDEDYGRVSKYTWYIDGTKRLRARIRYRLVLLHRYILNVPFGMSVDHIDANPLNNCKSNLRICTQSQNLMNQRPQVGKTSKYKGVHWYKTRNQWVSKTMINKRNIFIGYFEKEEEAALAYNAKAIELFGDYARLNVIEDETT